MPQFNAYPAMQAQTFDLPAIMRQAEELKGTRTMNRLREMQMGQMQGEVQRQGQLRGLMPSVGAEAGLGPSAQQALGIDPSMLGELLKIPKADRDRAKEIAEASANMGLAILTAPQVQWPSLDQEARRRAAELGIDPNLIPSVGSEQFEPFWRGQIAEGNKLKTLLDQVPDTPAGYQRTDGGLEFTPGGPDDPAQAGRLAAAKRDPSGSKKPAMLQVADAYKQAMERAGKKVSDAQALRWAKSSVNDTPQETWTKIYMANRRDFTMDEDEARKIADEITAYVHGESFGTDEATSTPTLGEANLSPVGTTEAATLPTRSQTTVTVPIPPEQGAPAPRRKPTREKSIETMTKDEVVALIYGGREFSQDEIDQLDARLEALGVPRP